MAWIIQGAAVGEHQRGSLWSLKSFPTRLGTPAYAGGYSRNQAVVGWDGKQEALGSALLIQAPSTVAVTSSWSAGKAIPARPSAAASAGTAFGSSWQQFPREHWWMDGGQQEGGFSYQASALTRTC